MCVCVGGGVFDYGLTGATMVGGLPYAVLDPQELVRSTAYTVVFVSFLLYLNPILDYIEFSKLFQVRLVACLH